MATEFSLEKLANKIYEVFQEYYTSNALLRKNVDDLIENKECLQKDPYCPKIFRTLIDAVVTQSWRFKIPKNFYQELDQLIENYGVKGLLEGKGREELIGLIEKYVSSKRRRRERISDKIRMVLDTLQRITLKEWVEKDLSTSGEPLLGEKGLNDFLRTAGKWDKIPIDRHEMRFIIRTGIYLAHPDPRQYDPLDKSYLREALKTFAEKYLADRHIAGINLGKNPGILDTFIWTYCAQIKICSKTPKCNKCPLQSACLYNLLKLLINVKPVA